MGTEAGALLAARRVEELHELASERNGVDVTVANRDRPGALRRVAAVVSPLLLVGVIVVTIVLIVAEPLRALVALLLFWR